MARSKGKSAEVDAIETEEEELKQKTRSKSKAATNSKITKKNSKSKKDETQSDEESEIESAAPTKRKLKNKVPEENPVTENKSKKVKSKIECVAIECKVSNEKHPNYALNNMIDKVCIEDIIGFNKTLFREQVQLYLISVFYKSYSKFIIF